MNKKIIVLSGCSAGKNEIQRIIREELNIWVWNINAYNVLSSVIRMLGYRGNRDQTYFDAVDELSEFANRRFNFSFNYIVEMTRKFQGHHKAELLLVHGCPLKIAGYLKDNFGAELVHVVEQQPVEAELEELDRMFVFGDENFEENIRKYLKGLMEDDKTQS